MRQVVSAPQRCHATVEVLTSPTWRGDSLGYTAGVAHAECETGQFSAVPVRLYGGPRELARGDTVEVVAQLGIIRLMRNAGLPDPYVSAARSGVLLSGGVLSATVVRGGHGFVHWVDQLRWHVRERIEATFAPDAVGMAKALVLGENDLTQDEDTAFKASGLAHLLAVSGTHLVFAILSVVSALRFVLCRVPLLAARFDVRRASSAFGVIAALVYADFAGGSGSAWRAAWMLAIGLTLRAIAREVNAVRAAAGSIVVGCVYDPLVAVDVSFMLSLAATFGLLTLGRKWSTWVDRWSLARPVRLAALGLCATLAAMLPCSVLLATLSSGLSVVGIFANVLAAPFGETIALPLCLVHALSSELPLLERGLAVVGSGALLVVRQMALATAGTSALSIPLPWPTDWQCAVVVLGGFTHWYQSSAPWPTGVHRWRTLAPVWCFTIVACLTLEWATHRVGQPQGRLRFTALDVGQGDAGLVDLPDGKIVLVDGGGFVGSPTDPGARVILPILRARRRDRLDVVVLSHPHPDHFGGLLSVMQSVEVGELWDTRQGQLEGAGPEYDELLALAERRGVPVLGPESLCGQRAFGGTRLSVLAPCPGFTPGRNANDNSFVLRFGFQGRALLLTGDAEHFEEAQLSDRMDLDLSADLLKVGHHGSRTSSTTEFLQRVRPTLATVSCGMRNSFGHPHAIALQRLRGSNVTVLRTDLLGSITWVTDGQAMWVETAVESSSAE